MFVVRPVMGAASTVLGYLGVDQVSSHGPDLTGIAQVITAIAGLVAAFGGLALALRRKPVDARDAALIAIAKHFDAEETDDEE